MAAARFIRFFSRRQAKHPATALNDENISHTNSKLLPNLLNSNAKVYSTGKKQQPIPIKHGLVCTIVFLDGDDVNFEVDRKALGKSLYDKVIAHTKLVEPDYFGLQFTDTHNVKQWLDPTKSLKKQCKIGPPYTFRFRVKFYTSDPQNLHDELTRYLFVLQLKDDIRTGKLDCPSGPDVELAALTMQAELGDHSSTEHSVETISEFRFLPDDRQTEEFEATVLQKWSTHKGLTPADCEVQYLNKARWLEMYGVDLHTVMGKDGLEYKLGLTPTGILVFENKIKIGLFVWSKVTRIDFHRNKLTIVVVEDDDNDPTLQRDFVFLFRCYDEKQCKHFWKCAMEYHIFFRTTSAAKVKQGVKSNFARTGSRFRFSGRTECQAATLGNLNRRSINFERKASQRFSRRASYAIRKKIQEHEVLREQEDERLKRLKSEQESKLDETKKSPEKTQDPVSISKRSSSQKILNLSPTQRLDNLIQASTNDLVAEDNELKRNTTGLPRPPPIPPRQVKPDDKTTTTKSPSPPPPPLVLVKPSNPTIFSSNNTNNMNTPKDSFNENNDQDLLIQMSPPKTSNVPTKSSISPLTGKVNSPFNRYTLANSQSPYVLKETYFYTESTTVNSNSTNNQNSLNSPAPVIVTRTLSTSNVRNASATIVQTTPSNSQISASSSIPLPNLYPRSSNRSLTSPSVGAIPSYHPITTEL
ncbi:unnamed protein product [Rotaria magnacalcarata]|uniref:FERM domain-containing protein n=1 Tax=Rotaria magnacalcarata TaxID=392030 RepID=A0A816ZJH7_9BILA|nr:unnamed protein product [Rotaria magnacalcarata]CAF2216378.1 unnamed protein product [Rotaria magnacalcarata]CAF3912289.1 unnamed protein product [Rotaria magnacalcarata]